MKNENNPLIAARLSRRDVIKWFAAVVAAANLPEFATCAEVPPPVAKGYGTDPKLNQSYAPGDFWPLSFTVEQRVAAIALADLMLPADHLGPAASALRVPDYIDEWISAPYPAQRVDRAMILPGLEWLDRESNTRFHQAFAELAPAQQQAIGDAICGAVEIIPSLRDAGKFFRRFQALAGSAYYGTEAGWKAIGYVGNVPLATFDGPPPEVLARLGVEQTVR